MSHSIPKASPNTIDDLHEVDHDPDESTRLLPGIDEEAASSARIPNTTQEQTPFPKAQLAALFAVRIVDPIAYQQIFPYVNQLLTDMRVAEPERVGFYSGLVVRMNRFHGYFCHDPPIIGKRLLARANVFNVSVWKDIRSVDGRLHHTS